MLGILPTTRFATVNPAPERDLRERLRNVLLADREPTEEEALVVGLLEPLGLIDSIVPKDQRKDARKRAKSIAEQRLDRHRRARRDTRGAGHRISRRCRLHCRQR